MFRQKAIVPAYIYPSYLGSDWDKIIGSGNKSAYVVMNPNSGPGTSQNSDYVNVVNRCVAASVPVIGYVYTNYGNRSTSQVEADVDTYYNWYNVSGIFFDQVATAANQESYYQTLTNYVKSHHCNGTVVLNPGAVPDQSYFTSTGADCIVVFENTETVFSTATFPSWLSTVPAKQVGMIVYSATNYNSDMTTMAHLNAAIVYVTNQGGSNPYGALPSYWGDMVAYPNGN